MPNTNVCNWKTVPKDIIDGKFFNTNAIQIYAEFARHNLINSYSDSKNYTHKFIIKLSVFKQKVNSLPGKEMKKRGENYLQIL